MEEARSILSRAERAGIGLIDTAANYGEAEHVLSQLDKGNLRIVTKTMSAAQGVDAVVARVRQSAKNLGRVDLLLVHGASDLAGAKGQKLWGALRALKEDGEIGGLGISAYVADDPVRLAEQFRPDAMQLPFSLLDQRLLHDGSLRRLKALGVEIHARSLFLQGLLFMDSPPEKLAYAAPMLARIRTRIERAGSTPLAAALGFVLSRPEVDVAVIGVNAARQLEEILAAIAVPLPELDWNGCALDDARILTPSLW
jgi:aryl-alcohol dehydrogenase-like predicted oxidoreductase